MKVHILPIGFTPEVFTNAASAIFTRGADRIISVHCKDNDNEARAKVLKTINAVERATGMVIERRTLSCGSFGELVLDVMKMLQETGNDDEVFVHLGGGERHLGLALIYATAFVRRKIALIPTMEYGFGERTFRYGELPPLVPQKLGGVKKRVLSVLPESEGLRLGEITAKLRVEFKSAAPSLMRHLKDLAVMNLVTYEPRGKIYRATGLAKFYLAMADAD